MSTPSSDDRGAPPEGAPLHVGTTVSVDDVWVEEWAAEGIGAFEQLLACHAAFDAYLRSRQDDEDGHDDAGDRR